MKLVFLIIGAVLGSSAMASDLYCYNSSGYEIFNSPGDHSPWTKISVKRNGVSIVEDLNENNSYFIQRDVVTNDYVAIIRAATVRDGVISSLVLSIVLDDNGGYMGNANAIVFNGTRTWMLSGFKCKTP